MIASKGRGGISTPFARSDQARNAQYPALHLCHRTFRWCQVGVKKYGEAAVPVGARKPRGDAEGVVLIARAALIGEAAAPEGRVDLGDGRAPGRDVPTIERPEMDAG